MWDPVVPRTLPCLYHYQHDFPLSPDVDQCVDLILLLYVYFVFSQLEVEDPRQRKLNLGCLNSGSKVKKKVKLVNRSSIDLSFKLLLNTQLDQRVKNVLMGVHMRIYSHTHTDHYRPSSSHPPGSVTQPNRGAQTESW